MKHHALTVLLLLIISISAIAEKPTYQTGELVGLYERVPALYPDRIVIPIPIYTLHIRVSDVLYLAAYAPIQGKTKPEWHVGTSVEFRVKKRSLFLKRPNGKELELQFLGAVPAPGTKPQSVDQAMNNSDPNAAFKPVPANVREGGLQLERGRMEAILDVVSKDVQEKFYDSAMKGLDWEALTEQTRQHIREADNTGEMIAATSALLDQLRDSHTFFIPPGRTQTADYGFDAKPFGNDILVYKLEKDGPAQKAGLELGDRIVRVDQYDSKRENFFAIMRNLRDLNPTTEMDLSIVRGAEPKTIKIPAKLETPWAQENLNVWVYDLARQPVNSEYPATTYTPYSGDVGYLRLQTFGLSAPIITDKMKKEIVAAMNSAKDSKALIIDLRGNSGGSQEILTFLSGYFADKAYPMGKMIFRKRSEPIEVKPVHPTITTPLIVLVDSTSASASEIFARTLQLQKRAVVIGDRTGGSVNMAHLLWENVGTYDKIEFGVEIASARVVMSNGEELENHGVAPDEFCIPSPEDLHNGKDTCLVRALELSQKSTQ